MDEKKGIFVGQFNKNTVQIIRASLVPWKRDWFVDLRLWERIEAEGMEKATVRGLRVGVDLIPDLIRVLEEARRMAESPDFTSRPGPARSAGRL